MSYSRILRNNSEIFFGRISIEIGEGISWEFVREILAVITRGVPEEAVGWKSKEVSGGIPREAAGGAPEGTFVLFLK